MAMVRVEPAGLEFDVRADESVAEAAWRQGYVWPTRCWGQAECLACFTRIVDGADVAILPEGEGDLSLRKHLPKPLQGPDIRLACRLKVSGDGLVLEKKGVQPPPTPAPPGA